MTPLPEAAAIEALLRLLKWNPRITLACAREKTGWSGDALKVLVVKRGDILGIMTIRGYTWVCTSEERMATAPKGVTRRG
jgi:hypothetical protein